MCEIETLAYSDYNADEEKEVVCSEKEVNAKLKTHSGP